MKPLKIRTLLFIFVITILLSFVIEAPLCYFVDGLKFLPMFEGSCVGAIFMFLVGLVLSFFLNDKKIYW